MPHPLDIAYALGLALAAPYWLSLQKPRAKVLSALRERLARDLPAPSPVRPPTLLIHAVSLGEINATRTLVTEILSRHPACRVVVSATTATGFARASELYATLAPRVAVARYPLDFSSAVARFLDHHRPHAVVLMELELWPNFLRICRLRDIPVVLVNGRLTKHSMVRYRWIAPLARRMFRSLRLLCVQDDIYRDRFIRVGARPDHVEVTGTMKFDTAVLAVDPAKVCSLAQSLALTAHSPSFGGPDGMQFEISLALTAHSPPTAPIWVCGSTGPGEEDLCLAVYRRLLADLPTLRLVLVPRKPERFDDVAALISRAGFPVLRRSTTISPLASATATSSPTGISPATATAPTPVILGDTMGELRLFYSLATVVFVGRSLVDLGPKQHGSDMLEPAALGKPVLTGLFTGNFADAMHLLRKNTAILEVATPDQLHSQLLHLLTHPTAAQSLASAARTTISQGQGATTRHADHILRLLPPAHP